MFSKVSKLYRVITAVIVFLVCSISLTGYSAAPEKAVVVNGKTLKHLGSTLREYLFFDIYQLDAYSESGTCSPSEMVYTPETKMIRLTMSRHIPVNNLKWEVKKAFKRNLREDRNNRALQKKISTFLAYFKSDLDKGAAVDIIYIPGTGSIVLQNGKALGPPIPGRDFPELTWRSYFGGKTCDTRGRRAIIEQCMARNR